ncbi:hypothetical protein [Streptococcus mitis]|jgi:hypothetical protein|uniref:Uncharacterized protein n=1 Tax=Streptococcus mitis TaxID=28037 RepID=A0A1X1JR09_STRMT|nr:hypothetical protein [Streptococcus mitis]MDU2761061.1 hypothetical protein [Streptococcus mitis]ORO89549.1 hypothetical protein B7702_04210 [Streptococcus mitis]
MKKIIKIITCLGLFFGLFSLVDSAQADSTDYNQLLPQIAEKWESKELSDKARYQIGYALVDIDKNGTDELLIGRSYDRNWSLYAVYYLNEHTPTKLIESTSEVQSIGRTSIGLFADGSVAISEWTSGSGQGVTKLYQLSKENKEAELVQKVEFDMKEKDGFGIDFSGKSKIDTSTIEYTSLNLPIIGDNMDPNPPMPKSLVDAKIGDEIPLPSELVGIWINKEPNNGTKSGKASSLILGEDGSYTGTFKDGDIRGKVSRLKKVSENGFIVLTENQENDFFSLIVGLGGGLPPGHRLEHGMVLEGRTLYNVLWVVKEGEEDYSKPSKLVTFVNPTYGPKKIEKKVDQEVAKQGDTVAESTQDSSEETNPEHKLFENIPVFGLVVGAGFVLVLILSIFWFKK